MWLAAREQYKLNKEAGFTISARLLVVASMALVPFGLAAAADRVSQGQQWPKVGEPGFILGADISWAQQQEDERIRFSDRGVTKEILSLLKDRGFNAVRLRIFHDPKAKKGYSAQGYCDLDHITPSGTARSPI